MRVFALAGLMLATMIGANSANAGFVDNFGNSPPAGVSNRGVSNSFIGNSGTWRRTSQTNANLTSTLTYTFTSPIDLSNTPVIKLAGVSVPATAVGSPQLGGPVTFSASAKATTGGFVSATPMSSTVPFGTSGVDLLFNLSSLGFVGAIKELQFTAVGDQTPFRFSVDSIQAVPEPTTFALIGLAATGGGVVAFRRRRKVAKD